jgi:hypothetical protein
MQMELVRSASSFLTRCFDGTESLALKSDGLLDIAVTVISMQNDIEKEAADRAERQAVRDRPQEAVSPLAFRWFGPPQLAAQGDPMPFTTISDSTKGEPGA